MKFVRKPEHIEAHQFQVDWEDDAPDWLLNAIWNGYLVLFLTNKSDGSYDYSGCMGPGHCMYPERGGRITIGDWVVKSDFGLCVMKDADFKKMFDPVPNQIEYEADNGV